MRRRSSKRSLTSIHKHPFKSKDTLACGIMPNDISLQNANILLCLFLFVMCTRACASRTGQSRRASCFNSKASFVPSMSAYFQGHGHCAETRVGRSTHFVLKLSLTPVHCSKCLNTLALFKKQRTQPRALVSTRIPLTQFAFQHKLKDKGIVQRAAQAGLFAEFQNLREHSHYFRTISAEVYQVRTL